MLARVTPAVSEVFSTLPVPTQERLAWQALRCQKALDRAIEMVLRPSVGRADDRFMVVDEMVPLYGVGVTPKEAMDDYRSVVKEYYEDLERDADELGPSLQAQLETLRRVFSLADQLEAI
jgi:hypothetical protein